MSAKYWTVTRPMSLVSCDIKVEHWASSSAIAFWISARLAEANGVGNAMDISCSTGAINMPNAERTPGCWGRSIREVPSSAANAHMRSEEHTSELQSLMRTSYAVFC